MEFQTEWNRKSEPTNPGDEFLPQYIETIDKNGKTYLKETKPINIYEKIQEESKGCSVYEILDKYLETGDETLLNKRKGVFGNFLNIPNDPREIHNMIIEAEATFDQLDRPIREEFENDVGVFKTSILDGTFEDRIAHYIGEKTKAEKIAELENQVRETTTKKGEKLSE